MVSAFRSDFGPTAEDYCDHRAGFPERLFHDLAARRVGLPNQSIVDLGTGTGAVAIPFAHRGAVVTALDVSPQMLAAGRQRAAAEGLDIQFVEAPAEATGLPGQAFHAVCAGQCWHWFDGQKALAEVGRVLVPGGMLAICHFDWLPHPGTVAEATEALILRHNPDWSLGGGGGTYPQWVQQVRAAGFTGINVFSFDVDQPYTHEHWRGRVRASAGVGGSLEADAVAAFDAGLYRLLADRFPDDPMNIPHRCWAMVARNR